MPPKRYHVFISHNSKDKIKIAELVNGLHSAGFEVWFDIDDIVAGDNWEKQILAELKDTKICIVFFSDEGWGPHHLAEVKMALALSVPRIIPVFLPGSPNNSNLTELFFEPSGLPEKTTYLDFRNEFNIPNALNLIQKAILGEGKGLDWSVKLERDSRNWEERKQPLYSGNILRDAQAWAKNNPSEVSKKGWAFINASLEAQKTKLRLTVLTSLFVMISIVLVTLYAFIQRNLAATQEIAYTTAQVEAQEQSFARATAQAEAQEQSRIVLARQLASQGEFLLNAGDDNQEAAVLLAIQSAKLYPVINAVQILQNSTLLKRVSQVFHDDVSNVTFSPDGRYFVSGSRNGSVLVWETLTGNEIARVNHGSEVTSLAFSPDGRYIVSGSQDGYVLVWETTTGNEVAHTNHGGEVYAITFSPDGMYVASGGSDNTARVWETTTGNEVVRINHDNRVTSIAFSPDGQYVASGSSDNTVRVWATTTGNEIVRINHDNTVTSIVFSPDGKYVVSGSYDRTVRIWESTTGKEIARMTHDNSNIIRSRPDPDPIIPDGAVNSVAFSPNGMYVASGSVDGTARVWEVATGNEIARNSHWDIVRHVAFSSDGKYVISQGFSRTHVWDSTTGIEADPINAVIEAPAALSPDGKYVVSGDSDGIIRVWETTKDFELARMHLDGKVSGIAFSSDGKYVVSGSSNGSVLVSEIATGGEIIRLTHWGIEDFVAFTPDSKHVIFRNYDGVVSVWDIATDSEAHFDTTIASMVVFSSDGRYIAADSWDYYGGGVFQDSLDTIRVWETATGNEISDMAQDLITIIAFSPNGQYIASGGWDNTVHIWETTTGNEIAYMSHGSSVEIVVFSPDGEFVASSEDGMDGGIIQIWESMTGNKIARIPYDGRLSHLVFSPDGKYIVSDNYIWEAATGIEIARINLDNWVDSLDFSPDGKYIVSANLDGTARVWEVATGDEIARVTNVSTVRIAAFSPDGRYVISSSILDGIVYVWDAASGNEIARLDHDNNITIANFSPDGKYIVTGDESGTVRIWLWQIEDLITDACWRVTRNLNHSEWQQYIGNALPYQAVCDNLPLEP